MSSNPEFGEDELYPSIDAVLDDGRPTLMTPMNTFYRTFDFGDGEFDHVIHITDDDQILIVFQPKESLVEELEGKNFPHLHHEELDEETIGYYATYHAAHIDGDEQDPR